LAASAFCHYSVLKEIRTIILASSGVLSLLWILGNMMGTGNLCGGYHPACMHALYETLRLSLIVVPVFIVSLIIGLSD
jgi:hypothetical protein